jgi:hypothetical protein
MSKALRGDEVGGHEYPLACSIRARASATADRTLVTSECGESVTST